MINNNDFLNFLINETKDGYKVIDKADIVANGFFEDDYKIDFEIKSLQLQNLISLKYIDKKSYCLKCNKSAQEFVQNKNATSTKNNVPSNKAIFTLCFLGAFFGAVLGIIIINMFF